MAKEIIGAALLGTAALCTAACAGGALTLFNRTIPRQDTLRVDLNEFADMAKWEEYKKIMVPNREWLTAQETEEVTITARDGIKLYANYFPADKPSDTIVICNHGYTGSGMRDCASISVFFHKTGYDCLIVDHRAHGKSEGKYIGFGILDRYDCRKWVEYVRERFGEKKKIILYGVSMGATTVLMTAGFGDMQDKITAIISDCAFTSPYDVFSHILKKNYHLPPFPIMDINDAMCRKTAGYGFKDYSTLEAVGSTRIPVLFIHGKEDEFVPLWMTPKNYEACRSEKELYICENAAHGASYYQDSRTYEEKVIKFLEKYI